LFQAPATDILVQCLGLELPLWIKLLHAITDLHTFEIESISTIDRSYLNVDLLHYKNNWLIKKNKMVEWLFMNLEELPKSKVV
jgi:hypothetical protein